MNAANKCRTALAVAALAVMQAHAQAPAPGDFLPNPLARRADASPLSLAEGSWNGANLEKRSNCSAAQNNGTHGTYAELVVGFDRAAGVMSINETAITGLLCTYLGPFTDDRFRPQWSGTYSCSDGKTGAFTLQKLLATPNEMNVRLAIKLNGKETCDVDAILGGSRF